MPRKRRRRPKNLLRLSQAVEGFLMAKEADGLSPSTINGYRYHLRRFAQWLGNDPDVRDITTEHIRAYIRYLRDLEVEPRGVARRPRQKLSAKTIHHHYIALSAFWTWLVLEEYVDRHIVRSVKPPRQEPPKVEPFTEDEIRALLKATRKSRPYRNRPQTQNTIPTALRDEAIILVLLDTGMRAGELCTLTLDDIDLKRGEAHIRGKGHRDYGRGKERIVYFSRTTAKAIWRYLQQERPESRSNRLFLTQQGRPLNPKRLRQNLHRLGERAGVPNVHPHRFRHTFAIQYLRNGGDIFTLQRLLGHSSLHMVRHYLTIAQTDVETAHRKASPVENWGL